MALHDFTAHGHRQGCAGAVHRGRELLRWPVRGGAADLQCRGAAGPNDPLVLVATPTHIRSLHSHAKNQCSNLTPIFIGMHRNAPLSPIKRVPGYTVPMVPPMHLAPMAPMNLVEQIRALHAIDGSLIPTDGPLG